MMSKFTYSTRGAVTDKTGEVDAAAASAAALLVVKAAPEGDRFPFMIDVRDDVDGAWHFVALNAETVTQL